MSQSVTLNNQSFTLPNTGDTNWGDNTTAYLVAIAAGTLQASGGLFTLTADANFGANFGLVSKYLKSTGSNLASSGVIRLANSTDTIAWRNAANSGDVSLLVNGGNQLVYNGSVVLTGSTSNVVTSITGTANEIIASSATGDITLSTPQAIATTSSPTFAGVNTGNINSTFIGLGRNRLINGDCIFDQVNEGSAYTVGVAAHYTLDQWRCEATGTPKFTVQQSSTAPTGFTKSILFTTSVSGTPAAGDGCNIEQVVPGPAARDFAYGTASAVTLTLSFWVRASVTGTYSISFCNDSTSRSYVSTYTVNSANTWEKKTVTFVGDTTGTWPTATNTFGMKVVWDAGSGSSVTTSTLNAWQAGGFWKASGSVSLVANAAATLYITGAQLEIGSTATSFEFLPYQLALMQVQQFLYKTIPQGTPWLSGQGSAGAIQYVASLPGTTVGGGVYVAFPTTMNNTPVQVDTFSTINGGGNTQWWNTTGGAVSGTPAVSGIGDSGLFIKNPQVTADNGGDILSIHIKVSAQLGGV